MQRVPKWASHVWENGIGADQEPERSVNLQRRRRHYRNPSVPVGRWPVGGVGGAGEAACAAKGSGADREAIGWPGGASTHWTGSTWFEAYLPCTWLSLCMCKCLRAALHSRGRVWAPLFVCLLCVHPLPQNHMWIVSYSHPSLPASQNMVPFGRALPGNAPTGDSWLHLWGSSGRK